MKSKVDVSYNSVSTSLDTRRAYMAEEKKESKAERVMLTMSSKLKEMIETEANKLGINTTQYIINLIVNDLKKK